MPFSSSGLVDWLGERQLSTDAATGMAVEVLCFRSELGETPAFEVALRKRVDDLRKMLHPSLATVHSVERLADGRLALVSDHVPGRRLSEILQTARGPVFALELIRQLTPVLATIHRHDPTLAHGLISTDRIVVTREGRLVLIEPALGSAVESLGLTAADLRTQFGLALLTPGAPVSLSQRADIVQLGFSALTLIVGRRLDPAMPRSGIPVLLDEFAAGSPRDAMRLRPWFERALQIGGEPFENAEQVLDAIDDLPDSDDAGARESQRSVLMFRPPADQAAPKLVSVPAPVPAAPEVADAPEPADEVSTLPEPAAAESDEPVAEPVDDESDTENDPMAKSSRPSRKLVWIAAGFALLSVAQTAIIANLMMQEPTPLALPPPVTAPAALELPPTFAAESLVPTPPAEPAAAPAAATTETESTVPPIGGRFGGVRVSAPIELQVFQDGALIGSTAGPIALAEGTHTLDVVNEALSYRSRQTVTVRAGQLTPLRLSLPEGRVNINATPWASVWIDGNAAGETPIANLALPIGTHEIVFRHPQLGEQRITAVVKADGVARISASFQR